METMGLPTLPANFVQKVYHNFVLGYCRAIEVFANTICELLLALPSQMPVPGHRW